VTFGAVCHILFAEISGVNNFVQRQLAPRSVAKNRLNGRALLVAFMLLVFGLRDYAVQTHVDPADSISQITAQIHLDAQGAGPHKNLPSDQKPDNCPLCQQFYTGQYVTPEALPFFLSVLTVSVIETVQGMTPHYDAVSHNWRSRGPPRP
jgi:hypothetical protein